MYANTIPLLKSNFDYIDELILLDANNDTGLSLIASYENQYNKLTTFSDSGLWFTKDVSPFIKDKIKHR